jgi:hypothetical protein
LTGHPGSVAAWPAKPSHYSNHDTPEAQNYWVIPEGFEHWTVRHVTQSAMTSSSDANVTIGVLTTEPRLQNACNETFLQPNYYTYSNSDLGVNEFDWTPGVSCDLASQTVTLSTEHKADIDRLKKMLCSAPLLVRPDPNREFELHTDWSAAGCGAILQQRGDVGEERVISYASRSNNKPESIYSSYAGECLAAVWGVRYHRVDRTGDGSSCTRTTDPWSG